MCLDVLTCPVQPQSCLRDLGVMEHIAHVQLHLLISYGQLLERAEVAGAPILKDREDREVKGDGMLHPCYLLSTVMSSTSA